MDITFKKKRTDLEGEVKIRSMDIEHVDEDFQPEIENCELKQRLITISSDCIRCNLCVEECPVDAIDLPKLSPAKILDECVKCEICVQTCPVNAVKVIESTSTVDEDVKYHIENVKIPHRRLKMEEIDVNDKCIACSLCVKVCPTEAITVKDGVAEIDKSRCVGCGACANTCPVKAIVLKRDLGPIIKTKELLIDQESCVQCKLCEENCPVEAIKIEDDKVVRDIDTCILCSVCSTKCPAEALKLEETN